MTLRTSFALLVAAARLACDCATSTAFRRSSAETRATLPRAADWILVAAASRTARIAASLAHAGVDEGLETPADKTPRAPSSPSSEKTADSGDGPDAKVDADARSTTASAASSLGFVR